MDSNANSQLSRESDANRATNLDEKYLEKKVEELHSNVRHITQLGMNWYAFFMTLNYVTLGWLASSGSINRPLIVLVAGLFFIQNGLGILGIHRVLKEAEVLTNQVSTYESLLLEARNRSTCTWIVGRKIIPIELYKSIAWSLIAVMLLLMAAWFLMAVSYIVLLLLNK